MVVKGRVIVVLVMMCCGGGRRRRDLEVVAVDAVGLYAVAGVERGRGRVVHAQAVVVLAVGGREVAAGVPHLARGLKSSGVFLSVSR